MPQIEWTDVLDIGLPEIDTQHKKLISFSNGLLQAMVNGMGNDMLEGLFEELLDYTTYHFADEEKYMEDIGYPDIDAHKAAHKKLINDVSEFRERLLGGNGVSPSEALDFINNWIIKHIMAIDSQVGQFAKRNA